ncbi:MAG: hypothetical protein J0H98_07120 [Solirubrobacterales bacterium]|nr:hypothetical protein [Solirubrobacterales bacterium]
MGPDEADLDYGTLTAESDLDEALYDTPEHDGDAFEPNEQDPLPSSSEEDLIDQSEDDSLVEGQDVQPGPEPGEPDVPDSAPAIQTTRTIDPQGAPVVAVCGTGGAAGTTTVAALLAFAASESSKGPVLLTDLGGPSASLAAYLGKEANHSLGSAVNAHRAGVFAVNGDKPFMNISKRLRVMAKGPDALDQTTGYEDDLVLRDLLIHAQEDHLATFVDCGRLELDAERRVAACATHIVWVSGARTSQARQARAKIAGLGFQGSRSSFLVVHSDRPGPPDLEAQREFGVTAEETGVALVVAPPAGDLVEQGLEVTARRVDQVLTACLGRILR